MKIEEAKDMLDAGIILMLDLPALPGYLEANYRAWVDTRGKYVFDAHYAGEKLRRLPLYGSYEWSEFLYHLTPILKASDWKPRK
ncbi:MAG: hypothetical protein NVS2B12_37030 [Ktedonobacteraceae bacterium]